ncbi:unnamed protein product [Owenia fusiformis]|uniref:DnaJ homolog subfamily C member 10 n=1 Tax=Owenia fusiformis TaxID=6347 RepID=A0A8S4P9V8_OWEFU|nr:unnamed protein product [Owenia fusiformis]
MNLSRTLGIECLTIHSVYIGVLVLTLMQLVTAEDYYELLGIDKSANNREIRKAFKKLALSEHPDKNQDDPKAHEKFVRITTAYDVLKDEELRKKYDMYGEEGLKDDHNQQHGYRSWNFYDQEFGIYDDDPEVITLSKTDFEQSVEGTDDIWFINYYSPQCSHCHELAPSWRELARELEGVIRIGAVNCEDDWYLCRQQGIRSYPSLLMYPQKEKYYGERSRSELLKYALKQVRAQVFELWSGNYKSHMEDEEKSSRPWLISFCGDGGDCLEKQTTLKLAAMLSSLVNVGTLDCNVQEKLCSKLGVEYGTYFFQPNEVKKSKGKVINSLDAKEIAYTVLEQLPDMKNLKPEEFKESLANLKENTDTAWMIHFTEDDELHDLELRKLPMLLEGLNVGRVNCRYMRTECNDLHIHKFPTFVVFKQGGGHEIHHGRETAHDIAAFARDSSVTPVRVLGPSDFPAPVVNSRETAHDIAAFARDSSVTPVRVLGPSDFPAPVVNSKDPWFVDFYAPWCPPCMRLLPEFRKTSKHFDDVSFGTVDCTVHQGLCNKYNIRSYPTTILFNQSVPHQYHGHHSVNGIKEFIEDTLKPPVITMTPELWETTVAKMGKEEIWLIDFYAPWCGPCQQLAPEWSRLSKMFDDNPKIHVAKVDCPANQQFCSRQSVNSYPSIRLYTSPRKFVKYSGWHRDSQSLRAWVYEYMPSKVATLNWQKFSNDILESRDPWVVDFYAPWCGHCQVFAPEFERVAESLDGKVHAGKVNCDAEQWLCQQAGIGAYPSVRYYPGSMREGWQQDMYGEDINSQDGNYIIKLLKSKWKQSQSQRDEL